MTFRKSLIRVSSESLSRISGLLVVLAFSRIYGVENFGIFSICNVIAMGVVIISDFGAGLYLISNLGGDEKKVNRQFHYIIPYRFIFNLILGWGSWLFFYFSGYNDEWLFILAFMLIWQIALGWVEFIGYAFLASGKVFQDFFIKLIAKVTISIILIYLIWNGLQFVSALQFAAAGTLIGVLFSFILYYRNFSLSGFFASGEDKKELWIKCSPLFVCAFASFACSRNDFLILQWAGITEVELGLFASVARLQDMMLLFVIFFMEAFSVKMSKHFHEKDAELQKKWTFLILSFGVAGVFFATLLTIDPYWLLEKLFGQGFSDGGWILAIWAWRIPLVFMRLTAQYGTATLHAQKESAQLTLAAMAFSVVCNIVVVKMYGVLGVVIVGFGVEVLILTATIFVVRKKLKDNSIEMARLQ
ncbi:MAG: hypothetical protein HQK84_00315 [Nitrospinae bacterium]|nr:hypothetical protein [Nitrospinota bacterium]